MKGGGGAIGGPPGGGGISGMGDAICAWAIGWSARSDPAVRFIGITLDSLAPRGAEPDRCGVAAGGSNIVLRKPRQAGRDLSEASSG